MAWDDLSTEQKEEYLTLFKAIGITIDQGISEYNSRNA